jgi:hypothetical protein
LKRQSNIKEAGNTIEKRLWMQVNILKRFFITYVQSIKRRTTPPSMDVDP